MDDGSKTLEQSIEMLRMAAAAGTTELVCTPHANRDYKFEPLVIRQRLKELEAGIGGAQIADDLRQRKWKSEHHPG